MQGQSMCVGRPPGDREETSLKSGDKEEEMFLGSGDSGEKWLWDLGTGCGDVPGIKGQRGVDVPGIRG